MEKSYFSDDIIILSGNNFCNVSLKSQPSESVKNFWRNLFPIQIQASYPEKKIKKLSFVHLKLTI